MLMRTLWRKDEGLRPVVVVEASSYASCTSCRLRCGQIREYMDHRSTVTVLAFLTFYFGKTSGKTTEMLSGKVWMILEEYFLLFHVLCGTLYTVTWVTAFQGGVNTVELEIGKGVWVLSSRQLLCCCSVLVEVLTLSLCLFSWWKSSEALHCCW